MAETVYMRPSSDVSLGHSTNTGSTGYNLLNEVTCDEDSTYIYGSGNSDSSTTNTSKFKFTCQASYPIRVMSAKLVAMAKISTTSNVSSKSMTMSVGSSSSTQDVSKTSYQQFTLDLNSSDISTSGNSASADVTFKTVLKTSKNSMTLHISQAYIEMSILPNRKWTVTPSIKGTGTVTGTGEFWEQDNVTVQIVPASGYAIHCMRDNGTQTNSFSYNTDHYEYKIDNITASHSIDVMFSDYFSKFAYKRGGEWQKVRVAYQKVDGVWSEIQTRPTGWSSGMYMGQVWSAAPWSLNQILQMNASIATQDNWMITPLVPIVPNCEIKVHSAQPDNGVAFNTYYQDGTYFDYWNKGQTEIATVDDITIYERILSATQVGNCYYTRANVPINGWSYCKVWSNGVLVFDGSRYAITV